MTEKSRILVDKVYNRFQWNSINNSIFKKQCRIFSSLKLNKDKSNVEKWEKSILADYTSYYLAVYMSTKYSKSNLWDSKLNKHHLHHLSLKLFNLFNYRSTTNTSLLNSTEDKNITKLKSIVYQRSEQILMMMVLDPRLESKLGSQVFSFRPCKSTYTKVKYYKKFFRLREGWFFTGQIEKSYANKNFNRVLYHNLSKQQTEKYYYLWNLFHCVNMTPKHSMDNIVYNGDLLYDYIDFNSTFFLKVLLSYLLIDICRLETSSSAIESFFTYGNNLTLYYESYKNLERSLDLINTILVKLGLNVIYSCSKLCGTNLNKAIIDLDNYSLVIFSDVSYIQPKYLFVKRHFFLMKSLIYNSKGSDQLSLILKINPIIANWSNYYKSQVSDKLLSRFDYQLFKILWKWCCSKFPKKNKLWVRKNLFRPDLQNRVVFGFTHGDGNITLIKKYASEIRDFSSLDIRDDCSPYDRNQIYWYSLLFNDKILYKEYLYLCNNNICLYNV